MNGGLELSNFRVNKEKQKELIDDGIVAEIRTRMQEISENIVEDANDRIDNMLSEVFGKFDKSQQMSNNLKDKYCDKRKFSKESILPEKQFVERNSLFTDLFDTNEHVKTLYNIFLNILILLFIATVIYDIMEGGSINAGISTIKFCFGNFSFVFYTWVLMKLSIIGLYILFKIWAEKRLDLLPLCTTSTLKVWNYGWLGAYILYLITFCGLSIKAIYDGRLPIASRNIILMEQIRMMMKSVAFVRSIAPKFLKYKIHADMEKPKFPEFSKYLYFLFVPTFVYKDHYPRTKCIRWKFVFIRFLEFVILIFYLVFIYERFFFPMYNDYGTEIINNGELLIHIIYASIPGILFFLCGFYGLLHSWLNAWAELLYFADRLFYKDWWNSSSYSNYYRTWNVVVHDWFYAYVYKDIFENLTNQNRFIATSSVFILSALVHEYIMTLTFQFFCPAMLFLFGFVGFPLVFIPRKTGNTFLWFSLILGNGIMCSMYSIEYFGRKNCAPHPDKFLDFILPRILYCHPKSE